MDSSVFELLVRVYAIIILMCVTRSVGVSKVLLKTSCPVHGLLLFLLGENCGCGGFFCVKSDADVLNSMLKFFGFIDLKQAEKLITICC